MAALSAPSLPVLQPRIERSLHGGLLSLLLARVWSSIRNKEELHNQWKESIIV
jgi:hypothetical protein